MPREVASAYTGSNITLWVGNQLITNAFGISYELSQNKRPIYGYNSMYFDAISTGQVVVLGQLYLTTTKPNYLSTLIASKSDDLHRARESSRIKNTENNVIELREIEKLDYYVENKDYSSLFNSKQVPAELLERYQRQLISELNYPLLEGYYDSERVGGRDKRTYRKRNLSVEDLIRLSNDEDPANTDDPEYSLYRPDQLTNSNTKAIDQISIKIHYGDPKEGVLDDGPDRNYNRGILNYSESFTVQLFGVHFLGESTQIMADDQPAMEVYKFIARDKAFINRAQQLFS
jgi:hypothetical protein